MDPFTVVSGVVALAGLGFAWLMHRRASRAEAEAAHLRDALSEGRAGTPRVRLPNQRPWRLGPRTPSPPVAPHTPVDAGGQ